MGNNRTAIRAALKTMLSGHTSAGTNVYTNRETSLWQSEVPAILIYSEEEPATREGLQSKRYIRTLHLTIKAKVEGSASVDDDLDALLLEIETLISADESLGGTVYSAVQTTTKITINSDGEQDVGVGEISLECQYIA